MALTQLPISFTAIQSSPNVNDRIVNGPQLDTLVGRINELVSAFNAQEETIDTLTKSLRPLYVKARATGFTLDYTAAAEVQFSDDSIASIAAGAIAVPASATTAIFVSDTTKVVTIGANYPPVCVPMAIVVTNATGVVSVQNQAQVKSSGLNNRPVLDVIKAGNLPVAGGADVNVGGWTESVDIFNMFDPITGIITIPASLRFMRLSVQAIFESTAIGSIAAKLRLYSVGSPDAEVNFGESSGTVAVSGSRVTVSFFWLNPGNQPLVTGSAYRLKAFLPSGQNALILGSAITRLIIDRIG